MRSFPARFTGRALLLVFSLWFVTGAGVRAHEVPNDVTIQSYIKPDGQTLRMLVRVPLIALRDMTWPFRGPDILDVSRATSELTDAATLWLGDESTMYEGTRRLGSPRVAAIRATLPTDRSFESYDQALALVTGPPPADSEEITVKEGFLDVLFEYPIESAGSRFSFEPRWGRLGILALTIVRAVQPDGTLRVFELQGDPGLIHLDPTWLQSFSLFLTLGLRHFLAAPDYLLLLGCLVIPRRHLMGLISILGTLAAAHSITLVASAYGLAPDALWFPVFIQTLLAAGIVYIAAENIVGFSVRRQRVAVIVLGLAFGFAFSFALQHSIQLAGSHHLTSVLAFNAGAAIALAAVMVVLAAALHLIFRLALPERLGVVVLSALCAHAAWHWTAGRASLLVQYQFLWPEMTAAFLVTVVRWLMIAVAAAGLSWFIGNLRGARRAHDQAR